MSHTQLYTDGLQTLKEVVKKALFQSKKAKSNYFLFFELAIDGYRYLNLHAVNEGKEWKKLVPDSIGCVDFPTDFEDFIGIYEPLNGELWPLTRNDSIVTTTTLSGITETQSSAAGEGVDIVNPIEQGAYVAGGVNPRGYYTIDWNNQRIFTNNIQATTVVLLYKSSGTRITDTTYVPNKYIPYLIAFILYEYCKYDDNFAMNRRQELLQTLRTERVELADLESPSLDEFLDAIRSTYYGTTKR